MVASASQADRRLSKLPTTPRPVAAPGCAAVHSTPPFPDLLVPSSLQAVGARKASPQVPTVTTPAVSAGALATLQGAAAASMTANAWSSRPSQTHRAIAGRGLAGSSGHELPRIVRCLQLGVALPMVSEATPNCGCARCTTSHPQPTVLPLPGHRHLCWDWEDRRYSC